MYTTVLLGQSDLDEGNGEPTGLQRKMSKEKKSDGKWWWWGGGRGGQSHLGGWCASLTVAHLLPLGSGPSHTPSCEGHSGQIGITENFHCL